jgi:hypothetical protein
MDVQIILDGASVGAVATGAGSVAILTVVVAARHALKMFFTGLVLTIFRVPRTEVQRVMLQMALSDDKQRRPRTLAPRHKPPPEDPALDEPAA